jgi:hypothetical protein
VKRSVLIALCLLVALPAAPALAKKKHKKKPVKLGPVVTMTATGNTALKNQESTAVATCPAGKQAVGGGFSSPLISNNAVVPHSSYRSSVSAWTVEGQVASGSGAVTAYAYCRNASAGQLTDITASATLSTTGEAKTVTPTCPTGTRLVGGGFQSTVPPAGDAVVFPQENFASSSADWTVTGVENQDGPITLTAHAYCLARIPAPSLVVGTASGNGALFAGATAATGSCPPSRKPKKGKKKGKKRKKKPAQLLSAGGFRAAPVNGSTTAPVMVFGQSRIEGTTWLSSGVNAVETSGSFTLNSQGFCI